MSNLIKWVIAIYVLSMLAWSSLLKANEVYISSVGFDPHRFLFSIKGQILKDYSLKLSHHLIEGQCLEDKPLLILEVEAEPDGSWITDNDLEDFDLAFDLRTLGLRGDTTYDLTVHNLIHGEESPIFSVEIPQETTLYRNHIVKSSGVLMKTLTGNWIIDRGDVRDVLVSTNLNLDGYVGKNVVFEGTEVLHRAGPVFDEDDHNPLRGRQLKEEKITMFLFSIRVATL